jgi:hypothetical protein
VVDFRDFSLIAVPSGGGPTISPRLFAASEMQPRPGSADAATAFADARLNSRNFNRFCYGLQAGAPHANGGVIVRAAP